MATKKSTKKAEPISDVEKPGRSTASPTSKAVIVTNRPIIKDPMVVDTTDSDSDTFELPVKKTSTKPKIQPLESSPNPDVNSEDAPTSSPDKPQEEDIDANSSKTNKKNTPTPEDSEEKEAKQKAEHDANLQKVVDAKTYYLPINAVEKRKTKRFVILGVLLSIFLIMIWINIALDAELVQIDGVTPITHFF